MTCAICKQEGHDADHCPSPLKSTVGSPEARRSPLILIGIVGILILTIAGAVGVYSLGGFSGGPERGPGNPSPVSTRPLR